MSTIKQYAVAHYIPVYVENDNHSASGGAHSDNSNGAFVVPSLLLVRDRGRPVPHRVVRHVSEAT